MKRLSGGTLVETLVATVIILAIISTAVLVMTKISTDQNLDLEGSAWIAMNSWVEETIENREFFDEEKELPYGKLKRVTTGPSIRDGLVRVDVFAVSPALKFPLLMSRIEYCPECD